MKLHAWSVGLQSHYGGGGGSIVQTFPTLAHNFQRMDRILIVKASSKRASPKRKTKNWQDKSISAPSSVVKEIKEIELGKGLQFTNDAPISSSRGDVDSETEVVSSISNSSTSLESKREVVLKACVTTSAAIFIIGILLQQATHFAAESGWSVPDCTLLLKFDVESWHLLVVCGLVLVVSSCRQLLLLAWPEFLESSDTANEEVLGPLQSIDYPIVSIMPGLSEEFLFRGALLPLCGLDWKGITVTGLLFGVLHLTGGRKTAFAIWASFVGILYGLACVATGNILVPMVAHSANNLIGATIWRLRQTGNSPSS
ncbi:hypothetical protein GOP47_0018693 [Adiantum capillus-veneris]|uniref:CAAX prenyl protease 2/Lysostaphin resistance protein A-like domain-containing protein n=1 Tax=Adiantum capillus-veneris TaxID=13818 RepID=A0A9D4Z915_ADICA|nr:hypothetical protein GOP47_0018693 [Adiantum capillus-veneris]